MSFELVSPAEMKRRVASVVNKGSPLTILAGAGISRDPPSVLPAFQEIKLIFIDAFRFGTIASHPLVRQVTELLSRDSVRPETLFQLLFNSCGIESLSRLTGILVAPCNPIHRVLGRMVADGGASVITTNFDTCIENAADLHPACILDDPDKFPLRLPQSVLFKVHGTVSNPNTILLSHDQTGFGRGLYPPSSEVFQELVNGSTVLIAGYRGADPDIQVEFMRAMNGPSPPRLLWVCHSDRSLSLLRHSWDEFALVVTVCSLDSLFGVRIGRTVPKHVSTRRGIDSFSFSQSILFLVQAALHLGFHSDLNAFGRMLATKGFLNRIPTTERIVLIHTIAVACRYADQFEELEFWLGLLFQERRT